MFRNQMPRYEVLSEDAMAKLDAGWRRLVSEIGVEFMDARARDLFRAAGQRVEENTVLGVAANVANPGSSGIWAANPDITR